jgi:uncharacterized membrane protein
MAAMMYGGAGGWPVWAAVLMWIGMLAFLGVLIWVGYTLMTRQHQQRGAYERRRGADAGEILNERLARGEIDAAEYKRLRGLIAAGDDQALRNANDVSIASDSASTPEPLSYLLFQPALLWIATTPGRVVAIHDDSIP